MDNQLPQRLDHRTVPLTERMRLGVTDNVADVSGVVGLDPAELTDTFQWLPTGPPPGVVDVVVPAVYGAVLLSQVVLGVVG